MKKIMKSILSVTLAAFIALPSFSFAAASDEQVLQSDFNTGKKLGQWELVLGDGARANAKIKNKQLMVRIKDGGTALWDVTLRHSITPLQKGASYKVEFKVCSEKDAEIYSKISYSEGTLAEMWNNKYARFSLKSGVWENVSQTFVAGLDPLDEEIAFQLGGNIVGKKANKIFFDDISITRITVMPDTKDALREHFDSGAAANWALDCQENASATAQVVNGELNVHCDSFGQNPWDINFHRAIPELKPFAKYKVEFKIRTQNAAKFYAKIGDAAEPFGIQWQTGWTPMELPAGVDAIISQTFIARPQTSEQEISFHFGGQLADQLPNDFFLDDIVITELS